MPSCASALLLFSKRAASPMSAKQTVHPLFCDPLPIRKSDQESELAGIRVRSTCRSSNHNSILLILLLLLDR